MKWRRRPSGESSRSRSGNAEASTEAAAAERRVVERWGERGRQWQPWLRGSPAAVDLLLWRDGQRDLRALLGDDAYRERLVELLSRVSARDCAAVGLGCTGDIEGGCRQPEICGLDSAVIDRAHARDMGARYGPLPGGCDEFTDRQGQVWFTVAFTSDDRHRAVHLHDEPHAGMGRLWVDGVEVAPDQVLQDRGEWLDDRFYIVAAAAPLDHPEQRLVFGHSTVFSLVIHDAENADTRLLVPKADERWTQPTADLRDGTWYVYPELAAFREDRPDRIFPEC